MLEKKIIKTGIKNICYGIIMDKLTPDVIQKLLAIANATTKPTDTKPTKRSYLTKLAENAPSYSDFVSDFTLPKGQEEFYSLDLIVVVGQEDLYTETILNYIKQHEDIPIFCSQKRNDKSYKIYTAEGKWTPQKHINEFIYKLQSMLLRSLKEWEKANPNYTSHKDNFFRWHKLVNIIPLYEEKSKKKIQDVLYEEIYNFHQGKY